MRTEVVKNNAFPLLFLKNKMLFVRKNFPKKYTQTWKMQERYYVIVMYIYFRILRSAFIELQAKLLFTVTTSF